MQAIYAVLRYRFFWYAVLAITIVVGAGWLIKDLRRAIDGEYEAFLLILGFVSVLTCVVFLIRRYWSYILDDRDVMEVFAVAATHNHVQLKHFHREHATSRGLISERGCSYSIRDGQTDIRISLTFLGKETADQKTIIGEQGLITIAVRVPQPFQMVIVNPRVDIRESLDVEFYAPMVLNARRYAYQRHGIVFSNYDKETIQHTFENPFIQTELIELFEKCRFKFAVFNERHAIAVKSATVENLARDTEMFPVLMNISTLIAADQHKQIPTLS
ncbi:MAG TPA: hypothetical protein PKA52_13885 [bacterium]|nr:hypothetical protein [bacterium]